eukprot:5581580-Pleurochrysis_carterae.AAC.3
MHRPMIRRMRSRCEEAFLDKNKPLSRAMDSNATGRRLARCSPPARRREIKHNRTAAASAATRDDRGRAERIARMVHARDPAHAPFSPASPGCPGGRAPRPPVTALACGYLRANASMQQSSFETQSADTSATCDKSYYSAKS